MAKRKMALYCIPNSRNAGKVIKQLMVMIEQIGPDFDIKVQRSDAQAKSELVDELVESFGAIAETMLDCRKAFAKGCSIVEIMTLIDQSLSVCEIQDYDSLKAILAKAKEAK